jgi:hypothetical protein
MAQKTVQTVQFGSNTFAVPSTVKLADLLVLVGLQAVRSTYNSDPWKVFEYLDDESVQLTIGTKTVYQDSESAENAKKAFARDRELAREAETSSD